MKQDSFVFKSKDGTVDIILTMGSTFTMTFSGDEINTNDIASVASEIRVNFSDEYSLTSFDVSIDTVNNNITLTLPPGKHIIL